MAIQFVGGKTASASGSTFTVTEITLTSGLTGGIASAVSDGDLVIAVFATGSTADRSLNINDGASNYTLIDSELYSDDTYDTNLRVAYKFVSGDTATRFGASGSNSDAKTSAVYVFRGVDSTTPLDVAAVSATGTNSGLPNPPSITPTTSGAFIVCVGASAHSSAVDTFTSSDLTAFQTIGSDDTNDSTLGIGYKEWTSGAFDAAQFGATYGDSTSYSWAAITIALRPGPSVDELTATGIATGEPTVGTPALGQTHVLTATGIATGAPTVGTPALAEIHALTATGIATGAPAVGTPALTQEHGLTATGISTGAPTVGSPAITQAHSLTATGITASPTVGTPALTQEHALSADGIATGSPSVGTPAIGQVHVLTATGIATAAPTVGAPTLTEGSNTDALTADGISTGAPTVGTPVLGIVSEIVVQPATGGWEWLNSLNPPSRRAPEPEPPKRRKKRRVLRDERVDLEPDPIIERGIVQTVPAWDAMARLQQMQAEAEIARAQRLRAIALADDDWLMMA